MKLVVFGGTGFAGSRIMAEARQRGHEVVAVARNIGADGQRGSVHDENFVLEVTADADVLVISIPGRPSESENGKKLLDAVPTLFAAARKNDVRIGIVGGAGSLHVSDGGPRLIDTPEFPEQFKLEAGSHAEVLAAMREAPADVDWFYLSPPAVFGAYAPGERTGTYRVGGEILLTDANGTSTISGDDYAIAFVDEIDKPAHRRQRFTVAY